MREKREWLWHIQSVCSDACAQRERSRGRAEGEKYGAIDFMATCHRNQKSPQLFRQCKHTGTFIARWICVPIHIYRREIIRQKKKVVLTNRRKWTIMILKSERKKKLIRQTSFMTTNRQMNRSRLIRWALGVVVVVVQYSFMSLASIINSICNCIVLAFVLHLFPHCHSIHMDMRVYISLLEFFFSSLLIF